MKNSSFYITAVVFVILLLFLGCAKEDAGSFADDSDTGVAGSYARFLVIGDFLYVLDHAAITTFSLSDPNRPTEVDKQNIGSDIETLFGFDGKLFIGSGQGLFIYGIGADGIPEKLGEAAHDFPFYPCDPVVANDSFAYVTLNTLRSVESCGRQITEEANLLKIYDITDPERPDLLIEYDMFNPKGIGIDGRTLFLCDDTEGLKIYDVADPLHIQLIEHFTGFTTFDVIPLDGLLIVVGPENIYQYDYTDLDDIQLLSTIPIQP